MLLQMLCALFQVAYALVKTPSGVDVAADQGHACWTENETIVRFPNFGN